MKISVVVPAYNASATIGICLDAIVKQEQPPYEIIVVNDASSDDTAAVAENYGASVITAEGRKGPAFARNTGAQSATGDVLVFVDSDVVVPTGLLQSIASSLEDPSNASAVQTIYSPRCPADNLVSSYQNFYYHHALCRLRRNKVAIFATWCAAVRKDAFEKAGGFNTRIPEPTVEDEELGYTLVDNGFTILLDKNLQVMHLASYDVASFTQRRFRMAVAQAKSGWRQIKNRLLARYINVHETGTHHSRWVVLSIILTMLAWCSLISAFITGRVGLLLFPGLIILALLCHTGFFTAAKRHFPGRVIPGFAAMCVLDMTILGLGIAWGTFGFVFGKKY